MVLFCILFQAFALLFNSAKAIYSAPSFPTQLIAFKHLNDLKVVPERLYIYMPRHRSSEQHGKDLSADSLNRGSAEYNVPEDVTFFDHKSREDEQEFKEWDILPYQRDRLLEIILTLLDGYGRIYKKKNTSGHAATYIIEVDGQRRTYSAHEILNLISLMLNNFTEQLLPEVFGSALPAGGGDEPGSWNARQRTVPWSIFRRLATLARQYEEKQQWKALGKLIQQLPLKKKGGNPPKHPARQESFIRPLPDKQKTFLIGSGDGGEPPDPGLEAQGVWQDKKKPVSPEDLLTYLQASGYIIDQDKRDHNILNAYAYQADRDLDQQVSELKRNIRTVARDGYLEKCKSFSEREATQKWFDIHSNNRHSLSHLRLLAELKGESVVVFSVNDHEQFLYQLFDADHRREGVYGRVSEGIPNAKRYFLLMPDGWQRIRTTIDLDSPLECPIEPDSQVKYSPTQVNPYLSSDEKIKSCWVPGNFQELLECYKDYSPELESDAATDLIRQVYNSNQNPLDISYFKQVKQSLAEAGLLSEDRADSSYELTLSKTLLGFIESFWLSCSDFMMEHDSLSSSDEHQAINRKSELREFLLTAKKLRENRFLGSIPAHEFHPYFLYIPLPALAPLVRERNELFRRLASILDELQSGASLPRVLIYGGVAVRAHQLARIYQGHLTRAVKRGLPAFNDIDLLVNNEGLAYRIMDQFRDSLKELSPHLRAEGPAQVPVTEPELKTIKLKVWSGNTRLFTLDISSSPAQMASYRHDLDYLPLPLPAEYGQSASPRLPFIGLNKLLGRLADEATWVMEDESRARIEKSIKNLRKFLGKDEQLKEIFWTSDGEALFSVLTLAPPAESAHLLPKRLRAPAPVAGNKKSLPDKEKKTPASVNASKKEKSKVQPSTRQNSDDAIESKSTLLSDSSSCTSEAFEQSLAVSEAKVSPVKIPSTNLPPLLIRSTTEPLFPLSVTREEAGGNQSEQRKKTKTSKKSKKTKPVKKEDDIDALVKEIEAVEQARLRTPRKGIKTSEKLKKTPAKVPSEALSQEREAVKSELLKRISSLQPEPAKDDSTELSHISQLFDGHSPEEEVIARLAQSESVNHPDWVISSLPIDGQSELWLFEALRRNNVKISHGRLQLTGKVIIKKEVQLLQLSLVMGHPVAAYLIGISAVNGIRADKAYLKQAGIKYHPARILLCQSILNHQSEFYDPKALVMVYQLASKNKQTTLEINWQDQPLPLDNRALAIDFALEQLMAAPENEPVRRKVAALFLNLMAEFSSSENDIGIIDLMIESGLKEYLPKSMHSLGSYGMDTRKNWSEALLFGSRIASTNGLVMEKNYNEFISRRNSDSKAAEHRWFEQFIYSGFMFNPEVWRRLHDVLLADEVRLPTKQTPVSFIKNNTYLRYSLCYAASGHIKEVACNEQYLEQAMLLLHKSNNKKNADPDTEFTHNDVSLQQKVLILSGAKYEFEKGMGFLPFLQPSPLPFLQPSPLPLTELWQRFEKLPSSVTAGITIHETYHYNLAKPGVGAIEPPSLKISDEGVGFIETPVCDYPDNPAFCEILLYSILLFSNACINNPDNPHYIQITSPALINTRPFQWMLKKAIAMGSSEACWISFACNPHNLNSNNLHWLFLAATQMPFARRFLLGRLLNYKTNIFNPELVPVLYRRLAKNPKSEIQKVYGIKKEPTSHTKNIEYIDQILMEWAVIDDPELQQKKLAELDQVEGQTLRFLVSLSMGLVDAKNPYYHSIIQQISKTDRMAGLYFKLITAPESAETIYHIIKSHIEKKETLLKCLEGVDIPFELMNEAGADCSLTLLQKLSTFLPEVEQEYFDRILKLPSAKFENELIGWLYSPEYLDDETRAASLVESLNKQNSYLGQVAYKILAQWNPKYQVNYYQSLVHQSNNNIQPSHTPSEKSGDTALLPDFNKGKQF